MPKKPPLTPEKRTRIEKQGSTAQGIKLAYNASQQARYQRELLKLVRAMTKQTKSALVALFDSGVADDFFDQQAEIVAMDASVTAKAKKVLSKLKAKFENLFNSNSILLASNMVEGASKTSRTALHVSLKQLSGGLSLKTGIVTQGQGQVAQAAVQENVSLIKSIPSEYFKNITGSVMRSITTGRGMADLLPEIQKYNGMTARRAKNLALDQTRKAYNSINKQRLVALGVKQFRWLHSGGGQVPRKSHLGINGIVFSFENLESEQAAHGVPLADRGIPGQAINCRCTMQPVIDFSEE